VTVLSNWFCFNEFQINMRDILAKDTTEVAEVVDVVETNY
jgi:hypothetical protein